MMRSLPVILLALLLGGVLAQEAQAVPGKLRIVVEGQGNVTGDFGTFCSGPATCEFPASVGRDLQAQGRPGFVFQGWTGCRAGTGGSSPNCFVDSYAALVVVTVRFRDEQDPGVRL